MMVGLVRIQGEFDQKSQIGTKYGTKNELLDLIKYAGRHGVVWFVVASDWQRGYPG